MDHKEDEKIEKAMSYDDPDVQERIITNGLGKDLWHNLIGRCNYYAAKVTGYRDEDITRITKDDKLTFSSNQVFYSHLFFIFLYPLDVLYKFICDIFKLECFPK